MGYCKTSTQIYSNINETIDCRIKVSSHPPYFLDDVSGISNQF